jgi:hypothetical protein
MGQHLFLWRAFACGTGLQLRLVFGQNRKREALLGAVSTTSHKRSRNSHELF